jgi:hypothetical protein
MDVFRISAFDSIFSIFPDKTEALGKLQDKS